MADEVECGAAGKEIEPIDVVRVYEITDKVMGLSLATSTRDVIMAHAVTLSRHLDRLVREELGADADTAARDLIRKAYALLAAGPPEEGTPCFSAYSYMKEAASITRSLLWIWAERNAFEACHGPHVELSVEARNQDPSQVNEERS
ncbi:hypothetical protein ACFV0R_11555 [Streptomyces sp. NPDC059578]|uniref:hypothetical protein n=1 Tax=unclassified Streptomyces TaxID=2593676 RepID=UPI003667AB8C